MHYIYIYIHGKTYNILQNISVYGEFSNFMAYALYKIIVIFCLIKIINIYRRYNQEPKIYIYRY